jgi:adenosine kinase
MSGQSQEKIELPPGIFLAIGNPLLDMSATVDSELLRKYDVTPDSAVLAEERHLTIFQELADNFEVRQIHDALCR